MLSKKKKIIILAGMLVLLVTTGVLNVVLNAQAKKPNTDTPVVAGTYFETYRTDRITTRNQTVVFLDSIIASADSNEADIASAKEQKLAISSAMDTELKLEGLIKASGFADCVVTLGSKKINVIVKADTIDADQRIQILYTIYSELGKLPSDVDIIPIS